jgi:hypothetical protein
VVNNTIYQPVGDAVRVQDGMQNVRLLNNILSVEAGYCLYAASNSQAGFSSDYNTLYATGPAKLTGWGTASGLREFTSLADWRYELGQDAHSLTANPQFIDADGADNLLGFQGGVDHGADDNLRVAAGSPTIDAGDLASDYLLEPGPNGGRINQGHTGNTPQATTSLVQLIQLLSPNGLEKFEVEQQVNVMWRTSGLISHTVDLEYSINGGATWLPLAAGVPSIDGVNSYAWTPSSQTQQGMVRVSAHHPLSGDYDRNARVDGRDFLAWQRGFGAGVSPPGDGADGNQNGSIGSADLTVWSTGLGTSGAGPAVGSDASDFHYLVTHAGQHYYVNDGSQTGDVFTTAIGDNGNSGKSPTAPMASLTALLSAYDLDPGDVVHVDAGTYNLLTNIVIAAEDAGVRIEGPATAAAVLNRDNAQAGSSVFVLWDADSVTLDRLSMTGGYYGVFADHFSDSDDLVISRSAVYGNAYAGVYLGNPSYYGVSTNDRPRLEDNDVYGVPGGSSLDDQPYGLYLASQGAQLLDNAVHHNGYYGGVNIFGDDALVQRNDIYNNAAAGVSLNGARALVEDNQVHGNAQYGVTASNGFSGIPADRTVVSGNTVSGSAIGISAGYNVLVTNNAVSASGTGIDLSSAEARDNVIAGNYRGISANHSLVEHNRVFGNAEIGVQVHGQSNIFRNWLYSNSVGIVAETNATYSSLAGAIANNLIYANANQGIILSVYYYGNNAISVLNNTIYQPVGEAIRVQGALTQPIQIRNNILSVDAGYNLYVASESQPYISSDYNLAHLGGVDAKTGFWNGLPVTTLANWQVQTGGDAHSVQASPGFADIDGADNILGYTTGGGGTDGGLDDDFSLSFGSPAINVADVATAPPEDLRGVLRSDGLPDLGALEASASMIFSTLAALTATPPMNSPAAVVAGIASYQIQPERFPRDLTRSELRREIAFALWGVDGRTHFTRHSEIDDALISDIARYAGWHVAQDEEAESRADMINTYEDFDV